jgi:hypothetical protein
MQDGKFKYIQISKELIILTFEPISKWFGDKDLPKF